MSQEISDIGNGILTLKRAFARAMMPGAVTIYVHNPEAGHRLMALLKEHTVNPGVMSVAGKPVEGYDGRAYMEAELAGTKIRWPAQFYAEHGGGVKLV